MSDYAMKLTKEDLEQTNLREKGVVLVDFWAEWCGLCCMLAPVLDEIAEEMQGKVCVGKLNIDECTDFVIGLGIMSIPTLILYSDGVERERAVGVQSKQAILDMITRAL